MIPFSLPFAFPRPRRQQAPVHLQQISEQLAQLSAQVAYLSAQVAILQTSLPTANRLLAPTPSQSHPIPRRPNLQLLPTRQIAAVKVTKDRQVQAFDQDNIPWLEFSGPLRTAGTKIVRMGYHGIWQKSNDSGVW